MKKLLLVPFLLAFAVVSHAQSTSSSWIDVTAFPYNAARDCSVDAGAAINSAISSAPAGSGVIFFPTGCYLIATEIVDANGAAFLTYLGEGNVELRASSATTPAGIIQFGNDTTTVRLRKIRDIDFNCNGVSNLGVGLDGIIDSEFDGVTVTDCRGWQVSQAGQNGQMYNNVFVGGVIDASFTSSTGVSLDGNCASSNASVNGWTFTGTKILGSGTGVGLELDGSGITFQGGTVTGFQIGIDINALTLCEPQGGISISGASIQNNSYAGIRAGGESSVPADQVSGLAIAGNFIDCQNGQYGVDLVYVAGFTVTGNRILNCTTYAIRGVPDQGLLGADNGLVGANFLSTGEVVSLQGSGNTVTNSVNTQSSSAYTLAGTDSWVNVTGSGATITVPHALSGQRWDVFNAGSTNITLQCDSGTIDGGTTLLVAPQTGKSVTTDGTSCFAH